MQCLRWVLKRTVSTKRLFCVFKRIFARLGPSVRLEENNNFLDSILFATKLILAQTTESSL